MTHENLKIITRDRIFNPKKRHKVRSLYYDWIQIYKRFYARYSNLFGIIFMMLLIPFDFLLFGSGQNFSIYRSMLIVIYLINLKIVFKFYRYRYVQNYLLLFPALSFNLIYLYFLTFYKLSSFEFNIVASANFLIIFGTSFFINRFWKEQYFLNFGISLLLFVGIFLHPEQKVHYILFIITHLSSAIICFFIRREFAGTMYEKFEMLTMFLPYQVAKYLGITGDTRNLEKVFRPKERFIICLCSDWRNYQNLTAKYDSKTVHNFIESYYDIIFEELENHFPKGNYFADWTADELFIVFYSNQKEIDHEMTHEVLKFAKVLGSEIPKRIWDFWELNLQFDIGIKEGVDFVGLQGPKKIKKTTVLGQTPGLAKRYEEEAKLVRKNNSATSDYPIIIMDNFLKEQSLLGDIFGNEKIVEISARSKNIESETCYSWQHS